MNLSRIAWYLEDKGFGQPGTNLFIHHMPHTVESGYLLIQQEPTRIDAYVHNMRRGNFQVIVRGPDAESVRLRGIEVSKILNITGVKMGDMAFRHIAPEGEPLVFPMPESRLVEASVNFSYTYILVS